MYTPGEEAVKMIKSENRVFVHGGAATPHHLLGKMTERASELFNVEIVGISLQGDALFAQKKYNDNFRINSLFVSENVRAAVNEGRGDYVPIFLSEIPNLFRSGILPIDVALVQVSPPDKHGYCSLGTSVDIALAGVKAARKVIPVLVARWISSGELPFLKEENPLLPYPQQQERESQELFPF